MNMSTNTKAVIKDVPVEQLAAYFTALDRVRESGVMNMFAAGDVVKQVLGVKQNVSRAALSAWMATFTDEPAETRAATALKLAGAP